MGDETTGAVRDHAHRPWLLIGALGVIVIVAAAAAVIAVRWQQRNLFAGQRPSGIPAIIPDGTINLMGLAPGACPPWRRGSRSPTRTAAAVPLSGWRGKVVVLEFMDPHCTDICPLVSQEFVDAYHDLGRSARNVVFAAVNVNQYFNRVPDVLAYSGPISCSHPRLALPDRARRRPAGRLAGLPRRSPGAQPGRRHPAPSAVYLIGPGGTER